MLSRRAAAVTRVGLRDPGAVPYRDRDDALEHLASQAEDEPLLLVLDEFPELAATAPGLPGILRAFLDRLPASCRPPAQAREPRQTRPEGGRDRPLVDPGRQRRNRRRRHSRAGQETHPRAGRRMQVGQAGRRGAHQGHPHPQGRQPDHRQQYLRYAVCAREEIINADDTTLAITAADIFA